MGMHPQYKRKMVLIMNKHDYTAKKHPALQTEQYVPVTVNVPDKYDLVGTVSELLTAMHAVDMETVEGDAVETVERSPMVTDAWVRLTMAIEELAKDMGTEATFDFVPASQQPNDPMGLYDATGKYIKDARLGEELSHGCIRLETNNAKWIYENILDTTTVIIH